MHAQLPPGMPAKIGHQFYSLLFLNGDVRLSFPLALLTPGMEKLRTDSYHLVASR